jgi:splicing factor U2AF subunit
MAKHLARIHGTEEDKVNCPFYFKIGACRHSERCSRLHHKPAFSPTLLIKHLYRHPVRLAELEQAATGVSVIDKEKSQEDFACFFEDLYMELSKFGKVESLHVCDNLGDHMIGHVYVKFRDEEEASDALQVMNGRYYDGRRMEVEFSPVTDFREARCRDYDEEACARGGFCNFLHVKPVHDCLIRSLEEDCEEDRRREEEDRREKDRDRRRKRRKRRDDREPRKKSSRKSSRRSSSRSRSRSPGDEDDHSADDGDDRSRSED